MGFDEYGMELAAEMAVMAVIGAETPRQRLYCGDERLKLGARRTLGIYPEPSFESDG
jgi:hypothetical protein